MNDVITAGANMIERDTADAPDCETDAAHRERLTIGIECELDALELIGLADDEPQSHGAKADV